MKSKLGIHIGFLACIGFLVAQFGGLIPATLLVGYVLLREENDFLRMSALKAFLIVLAASVLNFLIGVIPDILFELFDWISRIFGANTPFGSLKAIGKIDQIFNFFSWLVTTGKAILLVALAFLACGIKTIKIPFIENLIEKYASKDKE
ncbi:MAG: hypothetical protein IJK86_09645 [Lachnospiraceae bacterium]|nr:hypothetical protein [Lachnospiraceae bacterium]